MNNSHFYKKNYYQNSLKDPRTSHCQISKSRGRKNYFLPANLSSWISLLILLTNPSQPKSGNQVVKEKYSLRCWTNSELRLKHWIAKSIQNTSECLILSLKFVIFRSKSSSTNSRNFSLTLTLSWSDQKLTRMPCIDGSCLRYGILICFVWYCQMF